LRGAEIARQFCDAAAELRATPALLG
jgi:hypothetical protein